MYFLVAKIEIGSHSDEKYIVLLSYFVFIFHSHFTTFLSTKFVYISLHKANAITSVARPEGVAAFGVGTRSAPMVIYRHSNITLRRPEVMASTSGHVDGRGML